MSNVNRFTSPVTRLGVKPARKGPTARPATAQTDRKPGACACGGGCPRCQDGARMHTSLRVSQPGDAPEREADGTADRVMRMPASPAAIAPSSPSARSSNFNGGMPLDSATRGFFESRFQTNLSDVRVHTDANAAESARTYAARAYTLGSDIVFGDGEYAPRSDAGKHLLAHELAHVLQQAGQPGAPTTLQRRPVERVTRSVAQYEWTGTEQRKTTERYEGAYIWVVYDPATGDMTCTFRLLWRFPADWNDASRTGYKESFASVIKRAWDNKFPLVKWEQDKETSTTARVHIAFDNMDGPTVDDSTAYLKWKSGLSKDGLQELKTRWMVNVHGEGNWGDQVNFPFIDINAAATATNQKFHPSTFNTKHYQNAGIKTDKAESSVFMQTTAVHEFGHMIGLADEYMISKDRYDAMKSVAGEPAAKAELKRRAKATSRVQNAGNDVTKDAYRPFANILHELMFEDWRVK